MRPRVDPQRLRQAFDESGKSYTKVAAENCRCEFTIRRYVKGTTRVPDTVIESLARSVGRRPAELYATAG
jgi:hypothetical protein